MCHMEVNEQFGHHMGADVDITAKTTLGYEYPIVSGVASCV